MTAATATATGHSRFKPAPLTDAEKEFRRMINNAPVFIWMSNVTGDRFFFNNAWREFTGRDAEEDHLRWRELLHPDDHADIEALFNTHFAARTPYRAQYRLRRRDGSYRWIRSHPSPYFDAQNQFAGFISSCFDFHEQRELEAALAMRARKQTALAAFGRFALVPRAPSDLAREAAATTHALLDVDCVLLVAVDHAARRLTLDAHACRLGSDPPRELGPVAPAALARTAPVLMDDDPDNFPLAARLKREGIKTALACPIDTGEQLHGFILASTRERRDFAPGDVEFIQGIASILATVNQRDRAEKALAESERRLLQSQKVEALGLLAGGLAHDFKNLLAAISGYTELMRKDFLQLTLAPAAAPLLDTPPVRNISAHYAGIINATDRAGRLTRQLLDFSRGQPVRIERLDLNELIAGLKELLAAFLRGGIQLRLAPAPAPVFARADRNQIEQVILNLVINARDAMPSGGALTIATETREITGAETTLEKGPYAQITVADTGAGIPPEIQPKIFTPFFTTKARAGGTGLGLPTCASLVRNARGAISFETVPGKGTTFTVLLPDFAPAQPAAAETRDTSAPFLDAPDPDPATAETTPDAAATTAATLLLVEDDPVIREVTTMILESLGHTVRAFANGDALLAQCAAATANAAASPARDARLLITDLNMSGIGGRQLAECMRALNPGMRVLYISGFIADSDRHAQGHYLEKPFTRAALAQKIRDALG